MGPESNEETILSRDLRRQCYVQAPLLANDGFLWVVPGSHRRPATDPELAVWANRRNEDLPGQKQLKLDPGDIVLRHGNLIHRGYNPGGVERWTFVTALWRSDVPLWNNELVEVAQLRDSCVVDRMPTLTRQSVLNFLEASKNASPKGVWDV